MFVKNAAMRRYFRRRRRKMMKKNQTEDYQRLRSVWKGICNRCYNPKADNYCRYGAKGVTVCDEWRHKSKQFIVWALENGYKQGLTVDRINPHEGYSPKNCRLVSCHIQTCNQGKRKDDTTGYKGVFFNKETKKYYSSIQVNKKRYWFRYFDTLELALKARNDFIANNKLFEYAIQG